MTGQTLERMRPQEAALVRIADQLGIVKYADGAMLIDLGDPRLQEKYNVLAPATTVAKADANFTPAISVVNLDSTEFYSVGKLEGKDQFALSKSQLDAIAKVAGIEDVNTAIEYFGVHRENVRVTFTAKMRRPDGTWQTTQGSREWIEADEQEKLLAAVPEWVTKSGAPDKTNPKFNEWWAKNWLDRVKKHRLAMTETKARLRAYRSLLTLKGKYSDTEIKKPFLVASTSFTPDTSDLRVLGMLMSQGQQATETLFGAAGPMTLEYADTIDAEVDAATGELLPAGSHVTPAATEPKTFGERPTEDRQIPQGAHRGWMLSEVCEKDPEYARSKFWKTESIGLLTEEWLRYFHGESLGAPDDFSDVTFGDEEGAA